MAQSAQPNNSLINGMACLQLVVSSDKPMGVREVARELNLSPTRVNRLLATLSQVGLLEQTPKRKYRGGSAIHLLAAQSLHASPLLALALPYLMDFRKDGFTVALGVLWRRRVCYLFHERPWQNLEDSIGRHEVYPAEHSSLGMALLAAEHLGPPTERLESATITDVDGEWESTMELIRKQGYAVRHYANQEISIGVPIGTPVIAGIAVSGRHVGDQYVPEIAARLCRAAEEISQALTKENDQ